MQQKRILVTGANGYLGRHVVRALLELKQEVLACDLAFDAVDSRAHQINESIFSGAADIYRRVGSPDVCLHLAWRDGFLHNSPAHMGDLSAHYTFLLHMLDGGLPHIAAMGSMHEVGYWEGVIDEHTPTQPLSMYGIAKNSLRQALALMAQAHEAVYQWLRGYYILGDDLHNHSIFSRITQLESEGASTFPFTTGKNKFDFIYIDELAKQIACTICQEEVTGIINCCSGKPVSLAEQVEQFLSEHHFSIRPEYGAYPDRPYDSPGMWGDPTKIQTILTLFKK